MPPALPGQFLTLRLRAGPGARPLLRSYSLSGAPGRRVLPDQRQARAARRGQPVRAHDGCGRATCWRPPRRAARSSSAPGQTPVLLISAGVGATPVLAMLHALAAAGSGRDVWWLHGARSRAEEPFAAESRSPAGRAGQRAPAHLLQPPGPRRRRRAATTRRRGACRRRCWPGWTFRATPTPTSAARPRSWPRCPPPWPASASIGRACAPRSSAPRPRRRRASRPRPPGRRTRPPASPADGPLVAFARSGLTVRWDPGYASLLELAEACDVPVRWSCRTGVCHTCETACCPERSATPPTRSMTPPTAAR